MNATPAKVVHISSLPKKLLVCRHMGGKLYLSSAMNAVTSIAHLVHQASARERVNKVASCEANHLCAART
jgi:hypothetical protein